MESEIKRRERERLAFTERRDGRSGALAFAAQGMLVYRKALAQRNQNGKRCGYGQAYRRELVESCIVFRQFLSDRLPAERDAMAREVIKALVSYIEK